MRIALISHGEVANLIEADAGFAELIAPEWERVIALGDDDETAIGWRWEDGGDGAPGRLVPPPHDPGPEPAPEPRHITRLAFLNRFTDAEAVAIDLASLGATVEAAGMRRYMSLVNAAAFIDLDRQDTRAGVQALEGAGILAAGRALEILDAPIAAAERPASKGAA